MKSILVHLDDAEFKRLETARGNLTWCRFFLKLTEGGEAWD